MTAPKPPGIKSGGALPAAKRDGFSAGNQSGAQKVVGEVAPEVSQGAWRERVFTPRGVMPKDEVVAGLSAAVRLAMSTANHAKVTFEEIRRSWLPFLRQAVEQAGGDGLDAWLLTMLKPPGRKPLDRLWQDVVGGGQGLRACLDLASLESKASDLVAQIERALAAPRPKRLSFKVLERELEGKLEVDELLNIGFADDAELMRRLEELAKTMESLRLQIVERPGKQPDGLYANFVRLKAEARVLAAELVRRGGPPPPALPSFPKL
jgi:hypothetical protein